MQQKHLPFKMKSSYGKIVYLTNKIQSHRQNFRPVLSSLPIQHNGTAAPACQAVVHHFHRCQVTINYRARVNWCFSRKQQLNAGRSLPIPCLNLRFRFAAAVTAKTVIENYFHVNFFMLCAFKGLRLFHKNLSIIYFFIDVKRLLRMQTVFVLSAVTK